MARYLTKSRHKLGRECPTKLYFQNNKNEYLDSSLDDPFLSALARGGFQVGELAKIYNSNGVDIKSLAHDKSVQETNIAIAKENATVYEAAFCFEDLFIRVDVFRKKKNRIDLVEVKAKSIDPNEENSFWSKRELKKGIYKIAEKWKPYLYDVAFQTYVVRKVHPEWEVRPFLMLANKAAQASVDGLNQMFKLIEVNGRTEAQAIDGVSKESVGDPILIEVDVSEQVDKILANQVALEPGEKLFEDEVNFLASIVVNNEKHTSPLGLKCKYCQFKCDESESGMKSGFHECWSSVSRAAEERDGPFVFDIWNFRKASHFIEIGKRLARDLTEEDISPVRKDGEVGFSGSERQWEQIQHIKSKPSEPSVRLSDLRHEVKSWQFPLHFIDFETTMVALPFNAGKAPYEQIAFQFSHHIVTEDGRIYHAGQYLNREKGKFPNFDFVRALKNELDKDDGTIFRYAAHENTVLCQIYDQLRGSKELDKDELCAWIRTITKSRSSGVEKWEGERNMIDLCEAVKRFYYHPLTGGSNSIKKVLPAILNESDLLQSKYVQPIYGSENLRSLNYSKWTWIEHNQDGTIKDPYKLLPPIFEGVDTSKLDLLMGSDELADGGAAMTAYAKMQFSEMSEQESELVSAALLKYCELDTFAMVLLYEYWADLVGESVIKVAA